MNFRDVIRAGCASYMGWGIVVLLFIAFVWGPLGSVLGGIIHAVNCAGVYCPS